MIFGLHGMDEKEGETWGDRSAGPPGGEPLRGELPSILGSPQDPIGMNEKRNGPEWRPTDGRATQWGAPLGKTPLIHGRPPTRAGMGYNK